MTQTSQQREAVRLHILRRYQVSDGQPDVGFDDLTALAAQLCQAPIAALVFQEAEQLVVASHVGLYLSDLPRHLNFCSTLQQTGAGLVVPDLRLDERFAQHPLVARFPNLRFYAGLPLLTADGYFLGALEIMDWEPRELAATQWEALQALARQAITQLEVRRFRLVRRSAGVPGVLDATSSTPEGSVYDETLEAIARGLDARDGHEPGHLQQLARRTVKLAKAMGMPWDELIHVRRGVLLHDLGKLAIPDSILLKPSALTEEEWQIIRLHPLYGYEMLLPIEILHPALDIPYSHHERWDGQGYPQGLRGEAIPLMARVFAVVDVWDALHSNRPFRPGWEPERVARHIRNRAGTEFDPDVVGSFLSSL